LYIYDIYIAIPLSQGSYPSCPTTASSGRKSVVGLSFFYVFINPSYPTTRTAQAERRAQEAPRRQRRPRVARRSKVASREKTRLGHEQHLLTIRKLSTRPIPLEVCSLCFFKRALLLIRVRLGLPLLGVVPLRAPPPPPLSPPLPPPPQLLPPCSLPAHQSPIPAPPYPHQTR